MRWHNVSCLVASVLVLLTGNAEAWLQTSNYSSDATTTPSSLFSTALKTRRMFDTSLQSSIIRLIRELMLTPKVYESMSNSVAERRDGRILFPGESTSYSPPASQQQQARSASIIVASPSSSSGLRTLSLTSRPTPTTPTESISNVAPIDNYRTGLYEPGGILRKGRAGKVERVPRPIIINGNYAAYNAPRYNRMLEGPAPTVGGSATAVKIPPPSVIMSQPLRIIEGNRDSRGRSLKEIDVQGVRVIVGQRVPDDPEDKLFTYRNGRFIKGMFFPNDPSNSRPVNQEESNDISKNDGSSLVISSSYNF